MNTTKTELLEEFEEKFYAYLHSKDHDFYFLESEVKQFISKALDRYRDSVVEIVESKKLPVPNKYGTTVKVKRYNEVMDEILTALKQTNNNTTKGNDE